MTNVNNSRLFPMWMDAVLSEQALNIDSEIFSGDWDCQKLQEVIWDKAFIFYIYYAY